MLFDALKANAEGVSARGSARRATALPAQCILRALRRPRGVLTRGGAQAHVEQAAADISSILASEKKKKTKKLDANKMAALALIFNPVRAAPAPALPPRRAAPRRRVLTARARACSGREWPLPRRTRRRLGTGPRPTSSWKRPSLVRVHLCAARAAPRASCSVTCLVTTVPGRPLYRTTL